MSADFLFPTGWLVRLGEASPRRALAVHAAGLLLLALGLLPAALLIKGSGRGDPGQLLALLLCAAMAPWVHGLWFMAAGASPLDSPRDAARRTARRSCGLSLPFGALSAFAILWLWMQSERPQGWLALSGPLLLLTGATWCCELARRAFHAPAPQPATDLCRRVPHCDACGYPLPHPTLHGHCPECGQLEDDALTAPTSTRPGGWEWLWAWARPGRLPPLFERAPADHTWRVILFGALFHLGNAEAWWVFVSTRPGTGMLQQWLPPAQGLLLLWVAHAAMGVAMPALAAAIAAAILVRRREPHALRLARVAAQHTAGLCVLGPLLGWACVWVLPLVLRHAGPLSPWLLALLSVPPLQLALHVACALRCAGRLRHANY